MPFAHPLSIYPVSKAPRKVPTFRERKEVSSRSCRPNLLCLGVHRPDGRPTCCQCCACHPCPRRDGRSLGLHNSCVQAPQSLACTLDEGIVGCQLLLEARQVLWEQPMHLTTGCGLVSCVKESCSPHVKAVQQQQADPEQQQEPFLPVFHWGSSAVVVARPVTW